ncbi:hypothetical protein KOW79_021172 [Hemibagrus wyckioides]|uniref:Uncharacterized protein n=1 Tax=Hemibagrus wyckioides TaxID=337641 RepID=A0A9D3N315_9TELE|nr:hypothetical protein KOW79_021172 [Hemibagrus wyckioides]
MNPPCTVVWFGEAEWRPDRFSSSLKEAWEIKCSCLTSASLLRAFDDHMDVFDPPSASCPGVLSVNIEFVGEEKDPHAGIRMIDSVIHRLGHESQVSSYLVIETAGADPVQATNMLVLTIINGSF